MKISNKSKDNTEGENIVENTEQNNTEKSVEKKEKKEKKKISKKVIALIVVVAVVGGLIISGIVKSKGGIPVDAAKATRGELVNSIELNGNIVSNTKQIYYSDVDCKVAEICFKEGEAVKKGDLLVKYDSDDIDYRIEKAELDSKLKEDSYEDKIQSNGKAAGLYSEAAGSLKSLDEQITFYQTSIVQLDAEIEKKQAALASEGTNLQISLTECNPEDYTELQKQIQRNTYEQGHNADLVNMELTRQYYQQNLSEAKTKKAEMESQKKSSYSSMMTKAGKESLEISKESDELTSARDMENLQKAKNGIVSDFNGVVTKVSIEKGSTARAGAEMVTVESTDDLIVKFRVSKYDIENISEGQTADVTIRNKKYTGTITRIDKKVTDDAKGVSGVGMEMTIDSPDDNIILGLEAKAKIETLSVEDAILIPKGAMYAATEGDYVYTLVDGKAVKTPVEVGTYNSDSIEIISGVSEGDTVLLAGEMEITEGMTIKANYKDAE